MGVKIFLQFFAVVSLVMSALSQCREAITATGLPGPYGGPWSYDGMMPYDMPYGPSWQQVGCGVGFGPVATISGFAPAVASGGGFFVTSSSPIAPTGLTVTSENVVEGVLSVTGQLPFLGAVVTDGMFPTVGAGDVCYGCGDGAVGIVAEAPISPAPVAPAYGYGPALGAGLSYNGLIGSVGFGGCGGFGPIY